jgi:hypothetical protein
VFELAAAAVDTGSIDEGFEQPTAINMARKAILPSFNQCVIFHLDPMLSSHERTSTWLPTYGGNVKIPLRKRELAARIT